MKKLLIVSLLGVLVWTPVSADSSDRIEGIGKDREYLTLSQIQARSESLINVSEFLLLRHIEAKEAPVRIFTQYWPIILEAAAKHKVDPYMIAAICFVESYCGPTAVSPTGPVGIMQFTKAAAKEQGLKYTKRKAKQEVEVWQGKGNKRKLVKKTKTITVVEDERLDPSKAIPAAAKRLAEAYQTFGDWDFAIQQFHNGQGRARKIISLYTNEKATDKTTRELVEKNKLTYAQVYFDNSPHYRNELYRYLQEIPDTGRTYSFRVRDSMKVIKLFQNDSHAFNELVAKYQTPFKDDGYSAARMWYFFTPGQVAEWQFTNIADIEKASSVGRLLPLPEPWEKFGYLPKLSNNEKLFLQAEASTLGSLIYIMDEMKRLQGNKFQPYEISSLVRTSQVTESLQTFSLGKAFEFPVALKLQKGKKESIQTVLKKDRLVDLLFILDELESVGMISYAPDYIYPKKGKRILSALQVVAHPNTEEFFRAYYEQAVGVSVKTDILTKTN